MLAYTDRPLTAQATLPDFFAHSPDAALLLAPCQDGVSWTILEGNDSALAVYGYVQL